MPFALTRLLPGVTPANPWPIALYEELGRTIASIQCATSSVLDLQMPREKLDIAFERTLLTHLNAAAHSGPEARSGLQDLRRFLLVRQDSILEQLARLHELQTVARRIDRPFVLCHTDLHGNNLLVEEEEPLAILDWDDAKLAPPEHDLWAGLGKDQRGECFAEFLSAYSRAGGVSPLSLDHFAFYLLRRYFDDLATCLGKLLASDADEREDALLLYGMEACVERWSRLDETLATIAAALRWQGSSSDPHLRSRFRFALRA